MCNSRENPRKNGQNYQKFSRIAERRIAERFVKIVKGTRQTAIAETDFAESCSQKNSI